MVIQFEDEYSCVRSLAAQFGVVQLQQFFSPPSRIFAWLLGWFWRCWYYYHFTTQKKIRSSGCACVPIPSLAGHHVALVAQQTPSHPHISQGHQQRGEWKLRSLAEPLAQEKHVTESPNMLSQSFNVGSFKSNVPAMYAGELPPLNLHTYVLIMFAQMTHTHIHTCFDACKFPQRICHQDNLDSYASTHAGDSRCGHKRGTRHTLAVFITIQHSCSQLDGQGHLVQVLWWLWFCNQLEVVLPQSRWQPGPRLL